MVQYIVCYSRLLPEKPDLRVLYESILTVDSSLASRLKFRCIFMDLCTINQRIVDEWPTYVTYSSHVL